MSTAIQTPLPVAGLIDPGLVERVAAQANADRRRVSDARDRDGSLVHLASVVLDLHASEHQGPARYCTAACREADEVLHP